MVPEWDSVDHSVGFDRAMRAMNRIGEGDSEVQFLGGDLVMKLFINDHKHDSVHGYLEIDPKDVPALVAFLKKWSIVSW